MSFNLEGTEPYKCPECKSLLHVYNNWKWLVEAYTWNEQNGYCKSDEDGEISETYAKCMNEKCKLYNKPLTLSDVEGED